MIKHTLFKIFLIFFIIIYTSLLHFNSVVFAYRPSKIVIEKVDIYINKLPEDFENFTIAQISDLHLSDVVEKSLIEKTITKTNNLHADCIVITGDIANDYVYLKECLALLNNLSARYGVYIVPGNRERAIGLNKFKELLEKTNIIPLIDTSTLLKINDSEISLIGLSDNAKKAPALKNILNTLDASLVKIVCVHNPYVVYNLEDTETPIDLVLSGHTHGGQVVYPVLGAFKAQKVDGHKLVSGLYKFNNIQLYINRGIGVSRFNYRINCPPEITLITLRKEINQNQPVNDN